MIKVGCRGFPVRCPKVKDFAKSSEKSSLVRKSFECIQGEGNGHRDKGKDHYGL